MVTALIIAASLAAAVAAFLILVYARRYWLTRSGSVVMALRLSRRSAGRGWAPGYAIYNQGELCWYRMFSLSFGPREKLNRNRLEVSNRRDPIGFEAQIFPAGVQILQCQTQKGTIAELAMTSSAVTGFLSWLEAAPPGAASSYYDR
ncbi:DUF2550 domain-containing protein [Natronoglycomyces albus]|uniref:DUF2550 domain-containing protein n=1 Tax=Natronoglycomyces albus TaxID=2811108 RepID=A0A895XPE4_9ACTN|nr:DUF2550 domain-containing protein [Natronoglycomyces albus]QSB04955.1 DUF2550 domain-containing protein [Natronoglycomyces albus]